MLFLVCTLMNAAKTVYVNKPMSETSLFTESEYRCLEWLEKIRTRSDKHLFMHIYSSLGRLKRKLELFF